MKRQGFFLLLPDVKSEDVLKFHKL
jgi:hypothetical protein